MVNVRPPLSSSRPELAKIGKRLRLKGIETEKPSNPFQDQVFTSTRWLHLCIVTKFSLFSRKRNWFLLKVVDIYFYKLSRDQDLIWQDQWPKLRQIQVQMQISLRQVQVNTEIISRLASSHETALTLPLHFLSLACLLSFKHHMTKMSLLKRYCSYISLKMW